MKENTKRINAILSSENSILSSFIKLFFLKIHEKFTIILQILLYGLSMKQLFLHIKRTLLLK